MIIRRNIIFYKEKRVFVVADSTNAAVATADAVLNTIYIE